jgi:hypothetical protein
MHTRRETSRRNFGALVVLVLVLLMAAALGSGDGASAARNGGKPRPDYGSKDLFKMECELLGGVFTESLGYTYCHSEGRTVQCDANGNNCTSYPTSGQGRQEARIRTTGRSMTWRRSLMNRTPRRPRPSRTKPRSTATAKDASSP